MKNLTNIYISLFYSGYFKIWPGTFGSLISIFILFPIIEFRLISLEIFIVLFILFFFLSLFFIKKYSLYSNSHDSSVIVIDEFLGIYLILIFYDLIFIYNNLLTLFLVFILFRFFDISKIFPANIIDKKMKNSFGVILDDLVAAIYTIIILYSINGFI
tara:strand:- start:2955 stop:3428 length:474 start_codon:yes stop_codon:yes gene_type:complete